MSKLIYAKSKAGFETAYDAAARNNVDGSVYSSIAFLEDGFIHTHGQYFKIFKGIDSLLTATPTGNTVKITDSNGGEINITLGVMSLVSADAALTMTGSNGALTVAHKQIAVGLRSSVGSVVDATKIAKIPTIQFDAWGHPTTVSETAVALNTVATDYIATGTTPYYLTGVTTQATTESSRLTNTNNVYFTANGLLTADTFIGKLNYKASARINNVLKEFNNSAAIDFGTIYAPITGGTVGQILQAVGTTSAPGWVSLSTSIASGSTDVQIPSALAVYNAISTGISANNAMIYKGVIDASTNPVYPAADSGHTYKISVAGKIGGASGVPVEVGDMIVCSQNGSIAGITPAIAANWNVIQANIDGAVTTTEVAGLSVGPLVVGSGKNGVKSFASTTAGQMLLSGLNAASPTWASLAILTLTANGAAWKTYTPISATTVNFKASGATSIAVSGNDITISSSNDNTASAVSDILEGSNTLTAITYKPYATQQPKLSFDTSTTAPTRSERLNLNGYLYAKKLFSEGAEVLTSHQAINNLVISYKETAEVIATTYNPLTATNNTIQLLSGTGILMSGTANSGVISIAHGAITGAAVGTGLAQYVSAVDAYGHVSGRSNMLALTIKGYNTANSTSVDATSYIPNAAKTLSILAGTNVSMATVAGSITISSLNTWRDIFGYKISGASNNVLTSSTIGAVDFKLGDEFVWATNELKIGWAEVSTGGAVTYSV